MAAGTAGSGPWSAFALGGAAEEGSRAHVAAGAAEGLKISRVEVMFISVPARRAGLSSGLPSQASAKMTMRVVAGTTQAPPPNRGGVSVCWPRKSLEANGRRVRYPHTSRHAHGALPRRASLGSPGIFTAHRKGGGLRPSAALAPFGRPWEIRGTVQPGTAMTVHVRKTRHLTVAGFSLPLPILHIFCIMQKIQI